MSRVIPVTLAAVACAILAATATAAAAAKYAWTKAQTVAAVKTASVWKGVPPANGAAYKSPLKVTGVSRAVPYAKPVAGKASRWDLTVTLSHAVAGITTPSETIPAHTVVTHERFCVTPMSAYKGARSAFRIDGWAFNSTRGGCAHVVPHDYPTNYGSSYDWGGSATFRP